jgi:hypothetical protein
MDVLAGLEQRLDPVAAAATSWRSATRVPLGSSWKWTLILEPPGGIGFCGSS